MDINSLIKQRNLTKYRLAKESNIPYTTLSDICNGKTKLAKCSGETIYRLAQALEISMESLLEPECSMRCSFELFKSNVCHMLKRLGDINFLRKMLKDDDIHVYYGRKWYPESLYLLAMVDYVSRENSVPLCEEYNDLRKQKLSDTLYPSSVLAMCAATKSDAPKERARKDAIPEFLRFNIVENEVRNVI